MEPFVAVRACFDRSACLCRDHRHSICSIDNLLDDKCLTYVMCISGSLGDGDWLDTVVAHLCEAFSFFIFFKSSALSVSWMVFFFNLTISSMILPAFFFGALQFDGGDVFFVSPFQGIFEIDPFCCFCVCFHMAAMTHV